MLANAEPSVCVAGKSIVPSGRAKLPLSRAGSQTRSFCHSTSRPSFGGAVQPRWHPSGGVKGRSGTFSTAAARPEPRPPEVFTSKSEVPLILPLAVITDSRDMHTDYRSWPLPPEGTPVIIHGSAGRGLRRQEVWVVVGPLIPVAVARCEPSITAPASPRRESSPGGDPVQSVDSPGQADSRHPLPHRYYRNT